LRRGAGFVGTFSPGVASAFSLDIFFDALIVGKAPEHVVVRSSHGAQSTIAFLFGFFESCISLPLLHANASSRGLFLQELSSHFQSYFGYVHVVVYVLPSFFFFFRGCFMVSCSLQHWFFVLLFLFSYIFRRVVGVLRFGRLSFFFIILMLLICGAVVTRLFVGRDLLGVL
jgi:hypothetical protein